MESNESSFTLVAALSVSGSVVWVSEPPGGLVRSVDSRALLGPVQSGSLGQGPGNL